MTRILFVRHAETDTTATILQGRSKGCALNQRGICQAESLRDNLQATLTRIITSPLQRACQTAEIVAARYGLVPELDEAFNELDFGDWAGMEFQALEALPAWKIFNAARSETPAPGGESLANVRERVFARLTPLLHCEQALMIVTHCDVIRVILTQLLGAPLGAFERFRIDPASLTEVECFADGFQRLVRTNQVFI